MNDKRMDWHRSYTKEELEIVYPANKEERLEEFESLVQKEVNKRFQNLNSKEFTPATKEQIEEWKSWVTSESIEKTEKYINTLKQKWVTEKWDPFKEERKIANMFEKDKQRYMNSDRFKAYKLYGKEQYDLYNIYEKEYLAEDLKTLHIHIQKHGKIIQYELPPCPIITKEKEDNDN